MSETFNLLRQLTDTTKQVRMVDVYALWRKTFATVEVRHGMVHDDFIISAPFNDDGGTYAGQTYLLLSSVDIAESAETINDNTWHHVAGTFDGSNVKIYVDGVLKDTEARTANIVSTTADLNIGIFRDCVNKEFKGKIDEVRIWNDVRTEAEIRANMYQELAGTEDNLITYYKFNETSGTNANDSQSSSNNDGTLNNMTNDDWLTSSAFAGPKNCLDFDGIDDHINLGSPTELEQLGNGDYTIEAWIKTSASNTRQVIVGNYDGTPAWVFELYSSGELRIYVNNTGYNSNSTFDVDDDQWHHVAGIRDINNSLKMYVDGIEIYNNTSMSEGSFTVEHNTIIGKNPSATIALPFNGLIDEVRIWNDARTAEEIRDNMCRTLIGNEANLAAYYRFDQESASGQTTLYDITSNANHGTLTSMDATTDWVDCTAFDTWIGWFSSSWSEAKNWSRGLPSSTDNVGIHFWTLGHHPTISSSSSVKTLVIGLAADLTLNSGLTVDGNLFKLGNLYHNSQAVTFAGSSSQYLVGSLDFYNLTINNSHASNKVSAWWTTSLSVSNNLTITDGIFYSKSDYENVNIATGGTLELSGDITVSGNWDNDGIFTHNDHKVTFDGSSAQIIQGNNSTTFHNLTINNASGITLSKASTVNNALTLTSGKINLGNYDLTIGSGGSIAGASLTNYIVTNGSGVLTRNSVGSSNVSFSIGNLSYNPVIINNSGTADNFSVKVADGTPDNIVDASKVVNRTWTITEDIAGGSDVAITLQWNSDETGGSFNINDQLVMGRYLGSGTNWESKSAVGAGSNPYTAQASGFTSFSNFVVASGGSGTLPIELSTFTAQFLDNTPTLYWTTQSETDNMGWFVYRNVEEDFTTSEKISEFIEGHGTTTLQQSYIYEDRIQNSEVGDKYYYWLESIDYSGMIHHYNKVAILTIPENPDPGNGTVPEPEQFGLFQNEPNPVISSTRIACNLTEPAKVDLKIYNIKGQLVKILYSGVTSKHTVMWDGKNDKGKELENGVYFYKLIVNGKTAETKKLILMK